MGLEVPFLRPSELATDTSGSYEVLLHALDFYKKNKNYIPDTLILLQATSPFRTGKHIKEALTAYDASCEMLVSVKETKSNPYFTLREEDEKGWLFKSKEGNFTRRQDCPKVYEINGAIYVIDVKVLLKNSLGEFKKVRKYVMDEVNSHDIDTMMDWTLAEVLTKKNELCNNKSKSKRV
jgi:N-acylneuraminate cytidylyltransferase